MSYRNDHDAALHRVAALEHEIAELRRVGPVAERRAPDRRPMLLGIVALAMGGLLGVPAAIWMMALRSDEPAAASVAEDLAESTEVGAVEEPSAVPSEGCLRQIEARARLDAAAADPRSESPQSFRTLLQRRSTCSLVVAGPASPAEQNVVSLITVYYESDPVALDGYATAEQLWREYHRAHALR